MRHGTHAAGHRLSLLAGALCALAAVTGVHAAPETPGWTLAFQDDFDRPAIGCDWVVVRGDWHLADGKLRITRLPGWTSDSFIRTALPLRENVRLECDVRTPEATVVKAAVRIGDQYWDGGGLARGGAAPAAVGTPEKLCSRAVLTRRRTSRRFSPTAPTGWRSNTRTVVSRPGWTANACATSRPTCQAHSTTTPRLFTFRNADWDNVRIYAKPYGADFARTLPRATPESNRRATVDAAPLIDRAKADCGIQAAIDSLPPGGGAVILPKGEFVLRRALALREGVTLRGQGPETRLALPSPIPALTLKARPSGRHAADRRGRGGVHSRLDAAPCRLLFRARGFPPGQERGRQHRRTGKPLAGDLAEKRVIANFFPVIFAANTARVELRDLDILGRADDPVAVNGGYGVSAVTFFFVRDIRVCNVNVHGWKGDAFSFQGGRDILCAGNAIRGATGHGYHPGSCQQRTILSRCLAENCGGDGFYFCRYNQFSVMGNNVYIGNRGAMIGGLASAGDMFNTINRNYGRDNTLGVAFSGGANDVFCDNVIEEGPLSNAVYLSGGDYAKGPKENHVYTGPSRYHVLVGNSLSAKAGNAAGPLMILQPGAAANAVAGNRFSWKPACSTCRD